MEKVQAEACRIEAAEIEIKAETLRVQVADKRWRDALTQAHKIEAQARALKRFLLKEPWAT